MKRTRTITLVSFAATVLASCDNPPTVQECMAAAAGGGIPATCEQVLERNEAAFLTGGGIQPDADQCLAFARNESYPVFEVFFEGYRIIDDVPDYHTDEEKTGQGMQSDGRNGERLDKSKDPRYRHHREEEGIEK